MNYKNYKNWDMGWGWGVVGGEWRVGVVVVVGVGGGVGGEMRIYCIEWR